MTAEKPNVLILGGCGFIGRHLVAYLIENDLAEKVRVADKTPPMTAWLNQNHKKIFQDPRVEFVQVNLLNKTRVTAAFSSDGFTFDYVINLAAETRYGQGDSVYNEQVYQLSTGCAKQASESGVKRFVEVSSAQVYSSDKKASSETSKTGPWTSLAKCKLQVEEELKSMNDLDYVILRPATVYGVGDKNGLTPRLIIGAVYKQLNEKMKLLWTEGLKMSTVHVADVVRAIWHICTNGNQGAVYNLADKSDSTQGKISDLVCQLFNIKYEFFGTIISNMAKLHMSDTVEEVNEKHLAPWSEACSAGNIVNTPLSPYLDKELLYNNHMHIDGSAIESIGFSYTKPDLTLADLREVVDDYVKEGIWPPSLAPES